MTPCDARLLDVLPRTRRLPVRPSATKTSSARRSRGEAPFVASPPLRPGATFRALWCDLLSGTARPPPVRLHSAPSAQRPSTRPPSSLPLRRQCRFKFTMYP